MNLNSHSRAKQHNRGFTLVELLVVMVVALVIATFAVPSMKNMLVKSNMKNATESVALALRKARQVARSENTHIRVFFTQGSNSVQLKRPNDTVLQTIKLGQVNADTTITFQFNALGTVNNTGTVTLVSTKDHSATTTVSIDSLFGSISIG